uniref:ATP synthase complex subunit 8 n=1 Tax=Conotrachelus sp. KM-2017 TaxID=2219344 RepID=A0A346RFT7_9CUCU|nr:ATP synthase F0 subunit 8 [Conotrachelus sp. KM-2017]
MPQMAPMSWLLLYMYFCTLFLIIIILNYYMFLYKPKKIKNKIFQKKMNWKW